MVRHKGVIEPSPIPGAWVNLCEVKLLYENSRWYAEKSDTSFRHWIDELQKSGIFTIPLQYVPEYVGVSRESVLKRAKNGGLTVFSFIFPEYVENIFGKLKERKSKRRVDLVPKSECDQWRDILLDAYYEGSLDNENV